MPSGIDLSGNKALDIWRITESKFLFENRLEVLQERNSYPIVNQIFAKNKMTLKGGTDIVFDVILEDTGAAKFVLPYEERKFNVKDVALQGKVPWRRVDTHYTVGHDEVLVNARPEQLIALLKVRRTPSIYSLCNLLEDATAKTPANSADDLSSHGVPYYVVPITGAQVTAGTSGHQGRNPNYEDGTTMGNCAGLDTSVGALGEKYVNYNDVWSNADGVIAEDDVDKLCKMIESIKFTGPTMAKDVEAGTYDHNVMLTNMKMWLAFNRKARANNDSLGAEIGKFAGQTRIMGNPLTRWPTLDGDAKNPLIAANLDYFFPIVLDGDYFRFDGPMRQPSQRNLFITVISMTFNYACINRRKQGRIDYVAAA